MTWNKRITATAAVLGALAIAGPASGASAAPGPSADVCSGVANAGPMAVLGPYGPLGAYGPGGDLAGQPNPGASCGGAISFALPGQTVGSFVNSNLSIGQAAGPR